jgi:hypothetical protein
MFCEAFQLLRHVLREKNSRDIVSSPTFLPDRIMLTLRSSGTTTPKWAKKTEGETTINNENVNPGTIPDAGAKPATAPAPTAEDVADEIKPAPAAQ